MLPGEKKIQSLHYGNWKQRRKAACILKQLQVTAVSFPPHGFLDSSLTYQHAHSCVSLPGCIGTLQSLMQPARQNTKHTISVITLNSAILLFLFLYAQMHITLPTCTCITVTLHSNQEVMTPAQSNEETQIHILEAFSITIHPHISS